MFLFFWRLSTIQHKYVVVPADKIKNNIAFVCETYYVQCLLSEIYIENNSSSTATTLSKEEVVGNDKSVLYSFSLFTKDDDCDLPYMYKISQLYKNPYKQRYVAESSQCTTKSLTKFLTVILTAFKDGP